MRAPTLLPSNAPMTWTVFVIATVGDSEHAKTFDGA
jgi:hypothetical protein